MSNRRAIASATVNGGFECLSVLYVPYIMYRVTLPKTQLASMTAGFETSQIIDSVGETQHGRDGSE
jgi:hypothetical protein